MKLERVREHILRAILAHMNQISCPFLALYLVITILKAKNDTTNIAPQIIQFNMGSVLVSSAIFERFMNVYSRLQVRSRAITMLSV